MTSTPRTLLSSLLLLTAPVAVVGSAVLLRDSVPDPLPRHWGWDGQVDGTAALVPYTVGVLAIVSLLAPAALVPMVGWLAWFLAGLFGGTLVASRGAERAGEVDLPVAALVGSVVVATLVAWLLHRLLPASRPAEVRPVTDLVLAPGERVAWVGGARSRALGRLGLLVVAAGAAAALLEPLAGVAVAATGALMTWMHVLTVRVDERGVHVSWGLARWPGSTTPIQGIRAAVATEVEPTQWGGWGYRLSSRGTAHVVRRGPGLVLHRVGKGDLAITVDDADGAASVVNALVERARTPI